MIELRIMNKKEIIEALKKYNLNQEKYVIISGAAMVINGIKNTAKNIDIAVDSEYEKEILKNYKCTLEREIIDGSKKYNAYMIDDIINFSTHYFNEHKNEKKEGFYVQTPEEILRLKNKLNREKDKEDIQALKDYINKKNINSLALAYLGDAVYELFIREFLLNENKKVNDLQKQAIEYVSAKAQSKYLDELIENNILNDEEKEIVKRARNHRSHTSKTTDIITYKKSTGLEALIGYLKITNNNKRIKEIMKYIVGE